MSAFFALLKKDLMVELRQLEAGATLLFLSTLLTTIAAFGVNNSFLEPAVIRSLSPALYWMIFVLTASVTIGKTSEYDQQLRAIDGVILSGVSLPAVFAAKMVSNLVLIVTGQLLTLVLFSILLNIDLSGIVAPLLVVILLVALAYSSLVTLLSGMTSSSRIRSLLLPLIALPLLFPLFFCERGKSWQW